ncbi:hypothetical protein EIN_296930 [Entamoeba invadens IP1]|uniref:TLDc domain-containing protein n=1 Tax=Entamoeba invadens IP1 TaxID=370355 RepID=L7FKH8_ENTIV|nr:hypothetical protein EIN_296930 [Entamoeba invadens IP1]ELP86373.1 hypothetical protein EIN_296930 [Entamoeba invadens IP1]|eukprot:XP_004185719.1 hypothetical protein EIN_296930 [Entamoeba invadens IP1]
MEKDFTKEEYYNKLKASQERCTEAIEKCGKLISELERSAYCARDLMKGYESKLYQLRKQELETQESKTVIQKKRFNNELKVNTQRKKLMSKVNTLKEEKHKSVPIQLLQEEPQETIDNTFFTELDTLSEKNMNNGDDNENIDERPINMKEKKGEKDEEMANFKADVFKTPFSAQEEDAICQWTNLAMSDIIYDSASSQKEKSVVTQLLLKKKDLVFLLEDSHQNRFGGYLHKEVSVVHKPLSDKKAFLFSLFSNGRIEGMEKFEIGQKYNCCFRLPNKSSKILFKFGEKGDLVVKFDGENSFCQQLSFNFNGKENVLCGSTYPKTFTTKRIVVVQMKPKDDAEEVKTVVPIEQIELKQIKDANETKAKSDEEDGQTVRLSTEKLHKELVNEFLSQSVDFSMTGRLGEFFKVFTNTKEDVFHTVSPTVLPNLTSEEITTLCGWLKTTRPSKVIYDSSDKTLGDRWVEETISLKAFVVLLVDKENNKFGGVVSRQIPRRGTWVSDKNSFLFSFESNGRMNKPRMFPIKRESSAKAFYVSEEYDDLRLVFGEFGDLFLKETAEGKYMCSCKQRSYEFIGASNALCGLMFPRDVEIRMFQFIQLDDILD